MKYTPRKKPTHPQPMQPLVWDGKIIRFQSNAIVEFIVSNLLMDRGGALMTGDGERLDFNALMGMPWSDQDRDQFNMLHGYSVSGLPYRSTATQKRADDLAEVAIKKRYPKRT